MFPGLNLPPTTYHLQQQLPLLLLLPPLLLLLLLLLLLFLLLLLLLLLLTEKLLLREALTQRSFYTQQAFTHKGLYSHTETDGLAEGIEISYKAGDVYIYIYDIIYIYNYIYISYKSDILCVYIYINKWQIKNKKRSGMIALEATAGRLKDLNLVGVAWLRKALGAPRDFAMKHRDFTSNGLTQGKILTGNHRFSMIFL